MFTTRELWIIHNAFKSYKYATGEITKLRTDINNELKNRGEIVY